MVKIGDRYRVHLGRLHLAEPQIKMVQKAPIRLGPIGPLDNFEIRTQRHDAWTCRFEWRASCDLLRLRHTPIAESGEPLAWGVIQAHRATARLPIVPFCWALPGHLLAGLRSHRPHGDRKSVV